MNAEALLVTVGDARCALPMERVTAIRVHTGATRIPGSPEWIRGIVDRDGAPVELFDAARRLGVHSGGGERPCVVFFECAAMLVDEVDRLIFRHATDAPCAISRELVTGMIDDEGAALPLLDIDAFFAAPKEVA